MYNYDILLEYWRGMKRDFTFPKKVQFESKLDLFEFAKNYLIGFFSWWQKVCNHFYRKGQGVQFFNKQTDQNLWRNFTKVRFQLLETDDK